jgi:hypothetical protein
MLWGNGKTDSYVDRSFYRGDPARERFPFLCQAKDA